MGLGDYIELLRRRWLIVVFAALLGAVAVYVSTPAKPKPIERTFRASNTLIVNDPNAGISQQIGTVTFSQLPLFAKTGEVPNRVANLVGWKEAPAALAARVLADIDPATGTFRVTFEDKNDLTAVGIADAFADQLVKYLAERQDAVRAERQSRTQAKLDQLKRQIAEKDLAIDNEPGSEVLKSEREALSRLYSTTYESLQILNDSSNSSLQLTTLERAQAVPIGLGGFKAPSSRKARVPIATGIGALLGVGLAVLLERLDNKIRDRRRAERVFGVPVIAEIPTLSRKEREQLVHVRPRSEGRLAEAYRTLKTSVSLLIEESGRSLGMIVVTSSIPSEGKSTIAVNLSLAFAESGRKVVLVNADFRKPRLSREMLPDGASFEPRVEFSNVAKAAPGDVLLDTRFPRVRLLDLSCYRSIPPGTLVRATRRILRRLDDADVVIVDTPPLSVTGEALEFVPQARVVLHVARLGETRASAAHRAAELLRLGADDTTNAVVLNEARTGNSLFGQEYYGYNYSQNAPSWPMRAARRRRRPDRYDDFYEEDEELETRDGESLPVA